MINTAIKFKYFIIKKLGTNKNYLLMEIHFDKCNKYFLI